MLEFFLKIITEDGREVLMNLSANDSVEAFERAKTMYPTWKSILLEESHDPNDSRFQIDWSLGNDSDY